MTHQTIFRWVRGTVTSIVSDEVHPALAIGDVEKMAYSFAP
jgi:hypothetical protein